MGKIELPLEQASRLLEEHDFADVLNKIPDETFDLLGMIMYTWQLIFTMVEWHQKNR